MERGTHTQDEREKKKDADPFEMCHFSLIIVGPRIMYTSTSLEMRLKSQNNTPNSYDIHMYVLLLNQQKS